VLVTCAALYYGCEEVLESVKILSSFTFKEDLRELLRETGLSIKALHADIAKKAKNFIFWALVGHKQFLPSSAALILLLLTALFSSTTKGFSKTLYWYYRTSLLATLN